MSVALVCRNSRRGHTRGPCTKKDAPAKQREIWRKIFLSSRIQFELSFLFLVKSRDASTYHFEETRGARIRSRRPSVKIGTILRRFAWHLRKDDTRKSRSVVQFPPSPPPPPTLLPPPPDGQPSCRGRGSLVLRCALREARS